MPDKIEIKTLELGSPSNIAQMFKLPQQMIDYLWERIDIVKKKQNCFKKSLAGNISHSCKLDDPQNLVIENLFDKLYNPDSNPKMFKFIDEEVANIYKRTGLKDARLDPYLETIWVNFQKKGEFQPIHSHTGVFSFVIWMDIPYHSKDEAKLPLAKSSCPNPPGGNFSFAYSDGISRTVKEQFIEMSPDMNGHCCFFPSNLAHQVYPFYTSDKDRISISGNILYHATEPNYL